MPHHLWPDRHAENDGVGWDVSTPVIPRVVCVSLDASHSLTHSVRAVRGSICEKYGALLRDATDVEAHR